MQKENMLHIQPSAEKPFAFEGYDELVRGPLEHADPRSFDLIRELLSGPEDFNPCRFSFILKALSAITISPSEARVHWKKILEHKRCMESRLCRVVNVKTAAIDYYDQLGVFPDAGTQPGAPTEPPLREGTLPPVPASSPYHRTSECGGRISPVENAPSYFSGRTVNAGFPGVCDGDGKGPVGAMDNPEQRLKEEMLRAGRYKHALSAILVAVDRSRAIDNGSSPGTGVDVHMIIARIIRKSIRAVDILARYPRERFLLILPNTNKREALALAERLHINIERRAARIKELSCGVTVRLAVGQVCKEDNSNGFLKSLEVTFSLGGNQGEIRHVINNTRAMANSTNTQVRFGDYP